MFKNFMGKPELYAEGTDTFWTDEHISKYLLEAHLNPNVDASSKKLEFIDASVSWISQAIPFSKYPKLLDLGCGVGLYAERFADLGHDVTGIDFSQCSIDYAKTQSTQNKSSVNYLFDDYLSIDFTEEFDFISLIYCDFGALSDKNRAILLQKIYDALKPNGRFILDVFTLEVFSKKQEAKTWDYYPDGGFWSPETHVCLEANYLYTENNTELRQYIVQTDIHTKCYHIWEQYYTKNSFISELEAADFKLVNLYSDISGKEFSNASKTLCGIFEK